MQQGQDNRSNAQKDAVLKCLYSGEDPAAVTARFNISTETLFHWLLEEVRAVLRETAEDSLESMAWTIYKFGVVEMDQRFMKRVAQEERTDQSKWAKFQKRAIILTKIAELRKKAEFSYNKRIAEEVVDYLKQLKAEGKFPWAVPAARTIESHYFK
jgi:hypothetical protein